MADYSWPSKADTALLGGDYPKIDGAPKATGAAKYAYDISPPGTLLARALGSPHAHAKVKKIDVSPAMQVPGVKAAKALKKTGAEVKMPGEDEVQWQGDLIAVVVGESE